MKTNFVAWLVFSLVYSVSVWAGSIVEVQQGVASYYADSLQGHKTASGEPYDKHALTAAHRHLKFGTRVKVTSLKTGKSVVVRINDRGPYAKHRMIDLSRAAAEKIGLLKEGHGKVKLEVYGP